VDHALVYLISILLGIAKAVRDGRASTSPRPPSSSSATPFPASCSRSRWSCCSPAAALKIFRCAASSPTTGEVRRGALIVDHAWHMVLLITAMVISGFATLTMLTKNSFLEEIGKQYVLTARAKGLVEWRVLYGHVFRNAMLIVIAGFPAAFIGVLFSGSLLIEVIFSLDGMGLLGFEAAIGRDYPVMFGTLWTLGLLGLLVGLIGDLMYMLVDPRIDFEARGA
jgi:microcin C transport system permease protein